MFEILLGQKGNSLCPLVSRPLDKDDGGTGEDECRVVRRAIEALEIATAELLPQSAIITIEKQIRPPNNPESMPINVDTSHLLWLIDIAAMPELACSAELPKAYASHLKRIDSNVEYAGLLWAPCQSLNDTFHVVLDDSLKCIRFNPNKTKPRARRLETLDARRLETLDASLTPENFTTKANQVYSDTIFKKKFKKKIKAKAEDSDSKINLTKL